MTFPRISRRRFLMRTGGLVLVFLLTAGFVQAQPALATGSCYEPIPNPTAAGWSKEGNGTVTNGSPLELVDTGTGPVDFANLYCADDALFSGDITLAPHFSVPVASPDAEDSTGIHVTINDGTREIRVVVFRAGVDVYQVKLLLSSGTSASYTFPGTVVDFVLKRRSDGVAELSVPGTSFLVLAAPSEQRASTRVGVKTIEFGTYVPVGAASTTRWDQLGLPPLPAALSASFDLDPNTINLKAKGQYITAYIESSAFDVADIDVSTVTLQATSPVTSAQLTVATGSPTAVGDGNRNGVTDRMVKFDRATVQSWFPVSGEATFRVRGRLMDGRSFQGDGTGRIINAGVTHTDQADPASVQY
jgi:hypothetical protein